MNVFIDTNIFLDFYSMSRDSLDELSNVLVLQNYGKITLFLTGQVEDEFRRNREAKIADAIKRFTEDKPNNQIPHLVRAYPEHKTLTESLKAFQDAKAKLLEKVNKDILTQSLVADTLVRDVFRKARRIAVTDEIVAKAEKRYRLGNPPGKMGSLGDGINWEALLSEHPDGEELNIISSDGDWVSPIYSDRVNRFLGLEWRERKRSDLLLYKQLSLFVKTHYPEARLPIDLEKYLLIDQLASSGKFATTHRTVERLRQIESFSSIEVTQILESSLANPQVAQILKDSEVTDFINYLLQFDKGSVNAELRKKVEDSLKKEQD